MLAPSSKLTPAFGTCSDTIESEGLVVLQVNPASSNIFCAWAD